MAGVFLSLAFRVLVNLESLNSVETVGNLVRHRTAPIVVPSDGGYSIRFVPTISGESLAHAYQVHLVEEAKRTGLPLSEESERGEFIKFADENFLKKYGVEAPGSESKIRRTEVEIMLRDYVCDVGGFLYAGNYPVKRTSTFQVGYMVPAVFEVEAAALEAQFHVRFSPSFMGLQQPYNVEVGSAVYTFTLNMDVSQIARPSTSFGERDDKLEKQLEGEREKRVTAALSALSTFLTQLRFGAKRSRFLPNVEPLSAVAAVSKNTFFVVSPGNSKEFIRETASRKSSFEALMKELRGEKDEAEVLLFAIDKEKAAEKVEGVDVSGNLEEFVRRVVTAAFKNQKSH
ncbi:MAG: type I-A CRISPR-associated protein Cas7/Csa2 [Candidatus Freyarchaeota archaeon]|nr:type I-A CRISPR-associated protein Cas7/Csa2 [Candidatus Jordarchaeia archaeon]